MALVDDWAHWGPWLHSQLPHRLPSDHRELFTSMHGQGHLCTPLCLQGGCHLTLSLGFGRQRRWPFKCPERVHTLVCSHGTPRWIGAGQFLGLLSRLSNRCIHPQNWLQRWCPPPSEQPSLGSLGSPIPLSSPFPFSSFSANDFCS